METMDVVLTRLDHDFTMIFITTFLLLFFFSTLVKSIKANQRNITYRSVSNLFTPTELSFYHVLKQAVSEKFEIFGKVRIADVIQPGKHLNQKSWRIAFNRIQSKHFDYVICDPETLTIMAIIELDDSSHNAENNSNRDRLVNEVCQSANIRLIRFDTKSAYQVGFVREAIYDVLSSRS
ncbi:DUF2726 domain-containing protein [Nitrosomonas marina]|uniref:DUF2726 domain-containing protein n=1 Tax=Nitrosomonas marina TaxID=917 RepID=A0A1H8FWV0_9PROT|nr:DUF2726 domain-containing protein [Nitrosomonas marina]SEN36206.1 Protein of unknown function [Nitrosomonas marina]